MKNIQGTTEELELYHKNGKEAYWYFKGSKRIFREYTYDEQGNERTYKDSEGFSCETTYDDNGNELTYKDSNGVTKVFDTKK